MFVPRAQFLKRLKKRRSKLQLDQCPPLRWSNLLLGQSSYMPLPTGGIGGGGINGGRGIPPMEFGCISDAAAPPTPLTGPSSPGAPTVAVGTVTPRPAALPRPGPPIHKVVHEGVKKG